MLAFRRVLAFSSRVHTYVFVLYLFFVILFMLCSFVPSPEGLVGSLGFVMNVLGWTVLFEGIWLILSCIYQFFYSHVFVFSPLILSVVRIGVYLLLSTLVDLLDSVILQGVHI